MVMIKPTKEERELRLAIEKEKDPKRKDELVKKLKEIRNNNPCRKALRDAGISC